MVDVILVLTWLGVTLYAVFGGADFGAGFWDLLAGGARTGAGRRALMQESIGPVWEANHVWLIFVLVVLWTTFPAAYAQMASTLIVPATAVAIGIILRGSGFAFRKSLTTLGHRRLFGVVFATSSLITPFFLGTVAGAVASGRIPRSGIGNVLTSWWNPTSVLGGVLAVLVCAYLAAVFLVNDASRRHQDLIPWFRARAIGAGVAAGIVALGGIAVLREDAPTLFEGLTGRGLPLIAVSGAGGAMSLWLLVVRRYRAARLAAVAAVAAVIWGWAVAQYPWLLGDTLNITEAAASPATLGAVAVALAVGAVLFVPPLIYLLTLAESGRLEGDHHEGV
jgi:cytochrome d ubiquinol oxidase subunit II